MRRIYRWFRALLRDDVIGSKIDGYDRSCVRSAEAYDRQNRYIQRMERQS